MSGNRTNPILSNGIASPFSIYTSYVEGDRPLRVGTRGELEDGRVFYWARNATVAALTRGQLITAPAVTANHLGQTVNAASNFSAGSNDVVLTVGATAIVLREYEDGLVHILSGVTGQALYYQIRRHAGNAGTATSTAKLYSPVVTSTDATAKMSLVRNPYMNPTQSATAAALTSIPVGVPLVTAPAATSAATATAEAVGATYCWLQTWGPGMVLADAAGTVASSGLALVPSATTAGAVKLDTTATTVSQQYIVGFSMSVAAAADFFPVDLRIRP